MLENIKSKSRMIRLAPKIQVRALELVSQTEEEIRESLIVKLIEWDLFTHEAMGEAMNEDEKLIELSALVSIHFVKQGTNKPQKKEAAAYLDACFKEAYDRK